MKHQNDSSSTDSKLSYVRVQNLITQFDLKSGPMKAVHDVSFDIREGETLGIVGESGCGKSVTSFSLMGLLPSSGKIIQGQFHLGNKNVFQLSQQDYQELRGGEMAMIFQEPMTAFNPVLTIGQQIDEQIQRHLRLSSKDARHRSIEMLQKVGIPSAEKRYESYPHQLSGGMRQRAMIAMALSCRPRFLIADEPTTALDVTIQAQILELIQNFQIEEKMSVQFITHDLGVISEISERVMVMYGGMTCELASNQNLFTNPLHPYTEALIDSRPHFGQRVSRLRSIEGSVPAAHELPAGCPFANRCSRATEVCWKQRPELRELQPQHFVACHEPLLGKGG